MATQVFRALTTSFEFAVVLFRFTEALAKQIPPNRFVRAHRPEEICARNLGSARSEDADILRLPSTVHFESHLAFQ